MKIDTNRFGQLNLHCDELFLFPQGLIGMESLRQWALIPDSQTPTVAWLQSVTAGNRAIPLISPRAFFEDYRINIGRRDLGSLQLRTGCELYVMTTLSGHSEKLTTNLRAPVLLNLDRRLGCQVIADNEWPIQQPMPLSTQASLSSLVVQRRAA
ncbi:Flagellar assembly factor FliW [Novipirellula aureliae]|uniref:Flagellar assembly factor FliW n=1 Tax=Novipirellula aureliae TaxID=2527966 RepID=A0A5C6DK42_9BACT|nr:flagellar assembly protein FliW [Novipirellula aureliae]TWU36615.1 Flagellar assembly factor FliW [Novipirellula aureliae]